MTAILFPCPGHGRRTAHEGGGLRAGTSRRGAFGLALALSAGLFAQAALEYEVKAAFLLNFTKFVEWPPGAFSDASSPLAICILGRDPFGRALDEIVEGEALNGRKLVVRRISQVPAPQSCQLLFLDLPEKEARPILGGLGPGVLTVGEGDGFLRAGGMISFVIEKRRVRFDVNQPAADKAGLKISSRLLAVARTVGGPP